MTDPWLERFQARRDEREQADRTFTLLGETLTVKPSVAPEVGLRIARFDKMIADFLEKAQEAEAKGQEPPLAGVTDEDMLDVAESVVRDCLTADSFDAWTRLRSPDAAEPLDLVEIYGLARYVVGRVANIPTGGPSASSDGQQNGKASSTVESSSPAATLKV